ncbi:MAG: T9SS C-terminal target domain-containing protein, partial [Bacteroidia bacterium]|nr:T9SS C-terminal target domain-containing protein [Bacteroidia bacterium]MDW8332765.1 T9SS C-terminal target domain-containing protein [Bacteroidia bacterium]
MKIRVVLIATTLFWASCKKETPSSPPTDPPPSDETVVLSGEIVQNLTLVAQKRYMLDGFVYVKAGATLTIEPGTVVMGVPNTKATLIIERGAKIKAEGTREKPIVFTSAKAPGERNYGDWGGIIVCGRAPINVPGNEAVVEGGV